MSSAPFFGVGMLPVGSGAVRTGVGDGRRDRDGSSSRRGGGGRRGRAGAAGAAAAAGGSGCRSRSGFGFLGMRGLVCADRGRACASFRDAAIGALRELGGERRVEDGLVERRVFSRHRSVAPYSGPEMPPSLRIRQKWTARKITNTNGNASTWSTYQRNKVCGPTTTPPSSRKLACLAMNGA